MDGTFQNDLDSVFVRKFLIAMPRRLRQKSPRLIQRDREDLALADRLARLLDGFDRGGFLGGLPAAEVERWLKRRVVFFAAMRAEDLVDDDGINPKRKPRATWPVG
jgi:hypothetical protein